jgi:hypothetical protein
MKKRNTQIENTGCSDEQIEDTMRMKMFFQTSLRDGKTPDE